MSCEKSFFIIIYGKDNCPHCVRAKEFAVSKGIPFVYKTLGEGYTKEELIEKCSPFVPRTLPQIFLESNLDSVHIGGADDFIYFVKNGFGEKK